MKSENKKWVNLYIGDKLVAKIEGSSSYIFDSEQFEIEQAMNELFEKDNDQYLIKNQNK